jgi:hypothetical protein
MKQNIGGVSFPQLLGYLTFPLLHRNVIQNPPGRRLVRYINVADPSALTHETSISLGTLSMYALALLILITREI